jgi:hypothetical protein
MISYPRLSAAHFDLAEPFAAGKAVARRDE